MQRAEDFGEPLQVGLIGRGARPASPARARRWRPRTAEGWRRGGAWRADMPARRGKGKAPDARVVYPASICSNAAATIAGEPSRGLQPGKLGRPQPAQFGQLLQQRRAFAGDPAAGEAQDDEMARDAAGLVARDEFALARERDRLDRDAGFLAIPRARPPRASVSPASTTPPGSVNTPVLAPLARRATSTWPSRMIAALTARNGRSGYMRGSFMCDQRSSSASTVACCSPVVMSSDARCRSR